MKQLTEVISTKTDWIWYKTQMNGLITRVLPNNKLSLASLQPITVKIKVQALNVSFVARHLTDMLEPGNFSYQGYQRHVTNNHDY